MNEIEVARNYLETLLEIERADHDQILAYQYRLLESLCRHAAKTVPFYQNYTNLASPADPTTAAWRKLPVITRRDLVANGGALTTRSLPRNHGIVAPVQTGGSTGPAARVVLSTLESIARVVSTYRMFRTWNFDFSRPLFMIRKPQIGSDRRDGPGFTKWGYPWLPEDSLGPRHHMDISLPPHDQLGRLAGEAPAYVNTLPSNVLRIGLLARRDPSLSSAIPIIISVAETLPPEVRELARAVFGSRVINILSSAEAGVIAIECPESGLLHIQSEAVLAEIVDDTGQPCAIGQVGELVVTPLYNYATPLIRYASGDYVERGPPCSCGSNLPTISRVLGRREHIFWWPDGRRAVPQIDRVQISELLGHELWMFVQTNAGEAEIQIAAEGYQTCADQLLAALRAATDEMFAISIRSVPSLPLTSGGKRHFCLNQIAS